MPSSENRPVVGALDKGLIILDALMENEALGVTELAQRLGVNKSSACRLLRTLEARGFVAQDAPMGKYRLSGRIALRRPEALDNETLRALSAPYLRKLTDMTGESSALAVMSGNEGLLIANCMSSQLITASLSLGMAEPLYCTALGKVLLSVQSQVEQERLIRLSLIHI